jgi:prephenate dehydrogenase
MKRIQTAVRRYFEVIADKKANELVKIYAYNCITPEEHDAVLALASRMPQALSVALASTALNALRLEKAAGNPIPVACGNPPDTARLTPDDPAVWREILATNGECVRRTLATLEGRIGSLDSAPSQHQIEQIQQLFHTPLVSKLA